MDLSSVGKTEDGAKRMFSEAVETFFEELHAMGTLEVVLKDLGWTRNDGAMEPPKVVKQALMDVEVPALA